MNPNISAPCMLTITEALSRIEAGTLSPVNWVASCIERIHQREPEVRAWASINTHAIKEATTQVKHGNSPRIPIGVKDIIDVCGLPTRMGTNFHNSAPVVREGGSVAILRNSGFIFVGKTVTTELGHRHPGPTRNPRNTMHTPGGSSSGSAAAVADFMVPVSLGTQTTASIIRPAAFCGIVGYKPTYGDFDKSGMLANSPTMDTLGLLARSVEDVGLVRNFLLEEDYKAIEEVELSEIKFGLLTAYPWETADEETRQNVEGFIDDIVSLGAQRVDIKLDSEVRQLHELHRLISGYEFRRSIAFERTQYFKELSDVLRNGRLADGRELDSSGYQAAIQEVSVLRSRLAETFASVDILICPSAEGTAPAGLTSTGTAAFSAAWSLAGNPAITLPLFTAANGLPIGVQFIAGMGQDGMLLAAAKRVFKKFVLK